MPLATVCRRLYQRAPRSQTWSEHNGWSFRLRPHRRHCRSCVRRRFGEVGRGPSSVAERRRYLEVAGSIPVVCTTDSSKVEHQIFNLSVEGSNPSPSAAKPTPFEGVIRRSGDWHAEDWTDRLKPSGDGRLGRSDATHARPVRGDGQDASRSAMAAFGLRRSPRRLAARSRRPAANGRHQSPDHSGRVNVQCRQGNARDLGKTGTVV